MVLDIANKLIVKMINSLAQFRFDHLLKNRPYKYIYNNNLNKMIIYDYLYDHLWVFFDHV